MKTWKQVLMFFLSMWLVSFGVNLAVMLVLLQEMHYHIAAIGAAVGAIMGTSVSLWLLHHRTSK